MELQISTGKKEEVLDITREVEKIIQQQEIEDGQCNVFVLHTSAAVTVNENVDGSVGEDLYRILREIVPERRDYVHNDGNAHAHLRSSLIGNSAALPVEQGRLKKGTWQRILFLEFDGPRKRKVEIKIT